MVLVQRFCIKYITKVKYLIFYPMSILRKMAVFIEKPPVTSSKYNKQDQQGKAAFNERNPHTTQQQEPVARSPDGLQTKQDRAQDRARTGQSLYINDK
jgi:hypothetical protein